MTQSQIVWEQACFHGKNLFLNPEKLFEDVSHGTGRFSLDEANTYSLSA
jgi:hypothetical protein